MTDTTTSAPHSAAGPDHAPLDRAIAHAMTFLNELHSSPVSATATLDQLRTRLGRPLADDGCDAGRVIDDLVADVDGGLLGSAGGRLFAWVIGGSLPVALAADWLTSTWDQNAAIYACSAAAGTSPPTWSASMESHRGRRVGS